jgi:hypothetical protein
VPAYDASNDMGEEADAVDPGSPGGYVSFRGGATNYKAYMAVSSPVSEATIAAHVRVRSGWSSADFIILYLPTTASPQFSLFLLTGTSSDICLQNLYLFQASQMTSNDGAEFVEWVFCF